LPLTDDGVTVMYGLFVLIMLRLTAALLNLLVEFDEPGGLAGFASLLDFFIASGSRNTLLDMAAAMLGSDTRDPMLTYRFWTLCGIRVCAGVIA
jgi:hypothetical protein